jgi:hypothetical protein
MSAHQLEILRETAQLSRTNAADLAILPQIGALHRLRRSRLHAEALSKKPHSWVGFIYLQKQKGTTCTY